MRFLAFLSVLVFSVFMVPQAHADITQAKNFQKFDANILTSGQPSQKVLEGLGTDDVEVVINLVRSSEGVYNPKEGEILQSNGIEYIHNPVSWSSPKDAQLQNFLDVMKRHEGKKILVHCRSNARASAFVAVYRANENPAAKAAKMQELKRFWKRNVGIDLDRNKTWLAFLQKHVGTQVN